MEDCYLKWFTDRELEEQSSCSLPNNRQMEVSRDMQITKERIVIKKAIGTTKVMVAEKIMKTD